MRTLGGIDLPTIQKYLNLWYSLSLDLFGGEISSNAANFFAAGLKGRARRGRTRTTIALTEATYPMTQIDGGRIVDARGARAATR